MWGRKKKNVYIYLPYFMCKLDASTSASLFTMYISLFLCFNCAFFFLFVNIVLSLLG